MRNIINLARWQATVGTFASLTLLLGVASAAFIIMPTSVHAGEKSGLSHFFQRPASVTTQEGVTQTSPRSPGLAEQLDQADRLRERLKVVVRETRMVRQAALEMRDMVLAGCLLPHERRAQQLLEASTQTHERMLRDVTDSHGVVLSQDLELLYQLMRLERQLRGQRSQCQGLEEVAFSESGPAALLPEAPVKLRSPRQAPPPPRSASQPLAQRETEDGIY